MKNVNLEHGEIIRSFNKCDSALLIRYQRQKKSKIGSNRAKQSYSQ